MLKEDQTAELLRRCEDIAGRPLNQCRGRLKKAKSRAAAVWELIVTEAVAKLSRIEIESNPGASPDIKLLFPAWRSIWIEVTYLYPRFWKETKRSRVIMQWIYKEANRRGIDPVKIHIQFYGDTENSAGPVMKLPPEQDRKIFMKDNALVMFFDSISTNSNQEHRYSSSTYTISLSYLPKSNGPYTSSKGVLQEAPKNYGEHAIYRKLEKKAKQHDVEGPRVICLGSDTSNAVYQSMGGYPRVVPGDVIGAAFQRYSSLSAVLLVSIETDISLIYEHKLKAVSTLFPNPRAKVPLTPGEVEQLRRIDFNRWKCTFALNPWEESNNTHMQHVSGPLTYTIGENRSLKVEIPVNVVLSVLSGKTRLEDEYRLSSKEPLLRAISENRNVISCDLQKGDIRAGEDSKLIFEFGQSIEPVYWDPE